MVLVQMWVDGGYTLHLGVCRACVHGSQGHTGNVWVIVG